MPASIFRGDYLPQARKNKDLGVHAVWDNFSATHRQTVSHRAHALAVKCLINHRQQFSTYRAVTLTAQDDKHHLHRGRAGCAGIRHAHLPARSYSNQPPSSYAVTLSSSESEGGGS